MLDLKIAHCAFPSLLSLGKAATPLLRWTDRDGIWRVLEPP
jgi:hypothetical protein